jgi:hypothetical protein
MFECFKIGIPVYEQGTVVPWLVPLSELGKYLPSNEMTYSIAGWPQFRFTLFGITAVYAFDFVTDPKERLIAVQYYNDRPRSRVNSYRRFDKALCSCYGMPNTAGTEIHRVWDGGVVIVFNHLTVGRNPNTGDAKYHACDLRYEGTRQATSESEQRDRFLEC